MAFQSHGSRRDNQSPPLDVTRGTLFLAGGFAHGRGCGLPNLPGTDRPGRVRRLVGNFVGARCRMMCRRGPTPMNHPRTEEEL